MKKFAYWFEVMALGIILGLVIQGVQAWTEPNQSPPEGNVVAPVTTSGNTQIKWPPSL